MSTLIWGAIIGIVGFWLIEVFRTWRGIHKLDRTLQDVRTPNRKSCVFGHGPVPKNPPPHFQVVHPSPYDWQRDGE